MTNNTTLAGLKLGKRPLLLSTVSAEEKLFKWSESQFPTVQRRNTLGDSPQDCFYNKLIFLGRTMNEKHMEHHFLYYTVRQISAYIYESLKIEKKVAPPLKQRPLEKPMTGTKDRNSNWI